MLNILLSSLSTEASLFTENLLTFGIKHVLFPIYPIDFKAFLQKKNGSKLIFLKIKWKYDFYTPWKRLKTIVSLRFSVGKDMEHWYEIVIYFSHDAFTQFDRSRYATTKRKSKFIWQPRYALKNVIKTFLRLSLHF